MEKSTEKFEGFCSKVRNKIPIPRNQNIIPRLIPEWTIITLLARGICSGGLRERTKILRTLHSSCLLCAAAGHDGLLLFSTAAAHYFPKMSLRRRRRRQPPPKKRATQKRKIPFDFYAPKRVQNCAKTAKNHNPDWELTKGTTFDAGCDRIRAYFTA